MYARKTAATHRRGATAAEHSCGNVVLTAAAGKIFFTGVVLSLFRSRLIGVVVLP